MLENQGFAGLQRHTITIKPRAGAKISDLGWELDGAIANSAYGFAFTCIVSYAIIHGEELPQPLVCLLQSIPVQYIKFASDDDRTLQGWVDGAAQRHANRTVHCPIFISEDMLRNSKSDKHAKIFLKMYQQRTSVTPNLQMPKRMEDIVQKLMNRGKTCEVAYKMLHMAVVRYTWHDGPWTVLHLVQPFFQLAQI